MKKTVLFAMILFYSNSCLYAQTTSPLPYCHAGFDFAMSSGQSSDWINSVQLGTLNNVSNAESPAPHYIFYNNLAVPNLIKNSSYTLNVNFSIGGGCGYAAWIDYNHDDVFDATELVADVKVSTGIPLGQSVPLTATIAIPSTALTGNTRMRIRMTEDDQYHGAHPNNYELACDSMNTTSWGGETEDYTVNITGTTGINELNSNVRFSLYPNPANGLLNIESDLTGASTFAIYDIAGIKVLEGVNSQSKYSIDVCALTVGLYYVEIANGQQIVGHEKFIKQ
ncbi:MAG: T9SS type A sorting domain-containing protein [Flavipsychrobacter sp.]|nr:T9SS type A sorting domain-containing protein [Flavipsychrobacter sp.]